MHNSEAIKSRDNARLKFARRVRDGKEGGYIFIEGARLSGEALSSSLQVVSCFMSEAFRLSSSLASPDSKLHSRHVDLFVVSEALLDSISDTKTPQGIVLIAERPKPMQPGALFSASAAKLTLPIWIFLHEVNNPANLGAVVRTAEAAGARGILVSPRSTDPFSPKALRASMGSSFRLPIVEDARLDAAVRIARENGVNIGAVDIAGNLAHTAYNWKKKTLLVFGSEAEGLPGNVISAADSKLKVEMNSKVESLNLAVSCGVVLFEARRHLMG